MIACLALEHAIVPLLNVASVSATRNANAGPYMLFWWLWRGFSFNRNRWKTFHCPLLIAALASITILIQLTSFALLSDLEIVIVQASSHSKIMPTHFKYNSKGNIPVITHGSTWAQQLQSYVSFAEYHEPPANSLPDGVVDTGLTLRAFLPVADQQSRSMVANWDGIATVLDARSLCVRPKLVKPRLHSGGESLALETGFLFEFFDDPSDLGLIALPYGDPYGDPYEESGCPEGDCFQNVNCMIPLAPLTGWRNGSFKLNQTDPSQWRLVVCQPDKNALFVLQSQFQMPGDVTKIGYATEPNYTFGNAYVMVNVSSGSEAEWARAIPGEDSDTGIFRAPGTPPLGYGMHGQNNEWYDLIYSKDANLNLSVSVCYTAFDTADLHIEIDSYHNLSDITPSWNASKGVFEYTAIREQLGQELDGRITYSDEYVARNIMKLRKRDSWIPEADFGDYVVPSSRVTPTSWITDYANMAGSLQDNTFDYRAGANQARFLWEGYQTTNMWSDEMTTNWADASLIGLTQEILQAGGSLSFAMQSIVTSLTELAYYQQVQQLNGVSDVTSSSYVQTSAPVRKRGILAVTITLCVHILIVFGVILPSFLLLTKISALGNAWQAVAQIIDPKVEPILSKASLATDKEAEKEVKAPTGEKDKLENHEIVGLRSLDGLTVRIVSASNKGDVESGSEAAVMAVDEHGNEREDEQQERDNLLRQGEDRTS